MRPVTLHLHGLRSYRSPVTIDFTGAGLVAVVGDTGSGKSSILEGLTYALYNASTWSGKDVRELIADGATVMKVVLEFEADGDRYEITRATSRTNYPPAVHRLRCLSDPARPEIDGVDGVRTEVHRLVGLTYDAFLSAVILPQGRFQSLLQAKRGERVDILKGIFRLDIVETARGEAQGALARLDAALRDRDIARAKLLDDPAAEAKARKAEADEAAKAEKALDAAAAVLAKTRAAVRDAETTTAALAGPRNALDEAPSGTAERMRALLPRAAELQKRMLSIEKQRAELDAKIVSLKAALAALEKKGEGPLALAEAAAVLDRVDREQESAAATRRRLDEEEAVLNAERAALAKLEAGLKTLEKTAAAEADRASQLETAAKDAEQAAETARGRLDKALSAASAVQAARADAAARKKGLAAAVDAAQTAAAASDAAARDRDAAEAALAELLRRHAAAHAAEGLEAGEDCPVCDRPLPKGFRPPKVTGEAKARTALDRAAKTAAKALEVAAQARAEQSMAEAALKTAEAEEAERSRELEACRKALAALVPEAKTGDLTDALIRGLEGARDRARKEMADAAARAGKARDACLESRAGLEPRRKALAERQERREREIGELDASEAASIAALVALPKSLGLTKRTALSGRGEALEKLRGEQMKLAAETARLETLRDTAQGLGRQDADARAEWAKTVETPLRAIERELGHLQQRVGDAAKALGDKPVPAGEEADLEQQARRAERLESLRRDLLGRLEERLEGERATIREAEAAAAAALDAVGLDTAEELEAERISIRSTLQTAERDAEAARKQIEPARELDRLLSRGRAFRAAVSELAAALADGKFTAHVIERRQKELLGVATAILDGMTGGRYGFAGDFQVVDLETGQPRSTKTLSGGESFLASLALALALVEIAGRAGGRLDALFLDEGFGALDANALDEALGALESRAVDGRLVAVVSHLKAVAERIDRVLYVTKAPAGSTARWVTGAERDEVVDREIEAGLLS